MESNLDLEIVKPVHKLYEGVLLLNSQSPQATVCCYVGAAALVHFRPGRPCLPARGSKSDNNI